MIETSYNSLDEALGELLPYSTELKNGLTSHATMVAEALCALGKQEEVIPWIQNYILGMEKKPPAQEVITDENWKGALGKTARNTDWVLFFEKELEHASWKEVLNVWVDRLSPGFCADATHGIIRVGHAVRSLSHSESEIRIREFAEALGRWACTYQVLPDQRTNPLFIGRPRAAISKVRIVPKEFRKYNGTIVSALEDLDQDPNFSSVISMVDLSGDIGASISEMTSVFANVFLENAHDTLGAIVFTHGVTSLVAFRHLLPFLAEDTKRKTLEYAWQSSCSLYVSFGDPIPFQAKEKKILDRETLIDMAVRNGDEHTIKLTEACLVENEIHPDPVYFLASERACQLLKA
ncbi:questin oxidase family protein [Leptospira langatensis]|uniref:Questin oxidase family protein n=1 Tax=Leptospira langatensis TaxID=2484983 RepID=A0A5F1ZNY3_9LEPT|nr:questin oxidase family protein [Leptospira langatensis]TGK05225.1 questin oxidase family protein [Leptospira langatensis]TGL38361.1 questin oxidase family protein [Leptospira langatensis]